MENPKEYYESNINKINKNLRELERIILTHLSFFSDNDFYEY